MAEDETFKKVSNFIINTSTSLQFDKSEFSRKVNAGSVQVDDKTLQEVSEAMEKGLTSGFMRFAAEAKCIAAQWKNSNMKGSEHSTEVIEAALTHIIDNIENYPSIKKLDWNFSYSDDGGGIYDPGVRVFVFSKKK